MNGTLPNSIYQLSDLQVLNLDRNLLHGTLSDAIQQMYKLQYLDLRHNNFSGTIPSSIGNLCELTSLRLGRNAFSGKIPDSIRDLTSLNNFSIGFNQLTGTIPTWIAELKSLSYVYLEANQLNGTIPSTLFELSNLKQLNISDNPLTGTLPSVMVQMPYLLGLFIGNTKITGTIPNCLTNLSSLVQLFLNNNQMKGTIPRFIGDFIYLQALDLGANQLTGTIPSSFNALISLKDLSLDSNLLTGIIPFNLSNLTSLIILNLHSNLFSGTIPSSFNALILLQYLALDSNLLTGTVPDIFSNLTDLILINFSCNCFIGIVPSSIAKLQSLGEFFIQHNMLSGNLTNVFNGSLQKSLINVDLSNNQFTGHLPDGLFLSSSLVSIAAASNCFYGSIPSSICMNNQLVSLALDGLVCASSCRKKIFPGISLSYISTHSMNGRIPHCIWSMPNLQVLHMSGNSLSGSLPIDLSKSIMDLSLSYNLLTGSITKSIQERSWSNLDLSHNRLSGILLPSFKLSSNQSSLSLKDNRLSGFIPSSIRDLININILEGGYYDCKYDRSDLPSHDAYKDVYGCGSDTLNVIYYIWLGMIVITILVLLLLWHYKDNFKVSVLIGKIKQWLNIGAYLQSPASSTDIDNNLRYKLNNMIYLKRYTAKFEMMRVMSINFTLFIIIILLPIYTILGIYYRTHTYEYAWTVALMYISGKVPFGITISALIICLFSSFLSFTIFILRRKSNIIMIYDEDDLKQDLSNGNSNSTTVSCNHIWILYILYVMINLIIVAGVNIGYVLVVLYQSRSITILTQILLSIFKWFWINYISPIMVQWMINYLKIDNVSQKNTLFFLQFVVSIFNTIIIPCLVVMVISPNCFYHAFRWESVVTSKYSFNSCVGVVIYPNSTVCIQYETQYAEASYSPPFTYSYQCGSELISYYAPVFVLLCMLSTFIIPIIQIIWIKMKLPNILQFGHLFHPTTLDNAVKTIMNINEINDVFSCELVFIGLQITFGTIFPPLAVVLLMALSTETYCHQVLLGRFIRYVLYSNIHSRLDMLEDNLKVQPLLSTIQKCGWFLLYTACCFYTLFLFDILGDSVGFNGAYWILIVMPCLPLITYIMYELSKYVTKTTSDKQNEVYVNEDDNNNNATADIQLTSTLSMVSNPLSNSSEFIRDSSINDIDASDRGFGSFRFEANK